MTYSTNLENIDGEALKKIITKRGLVMADVSDAIGFEKNYISRSISRGTMGKSAMAALKGLYGISPEEYKKKQPVAVPEQLELPLFNQGSGLDYDRLAETIEKAVFAALKKAREE